LNFKIEGWKTLNERYGRSTDVFDDFYEFDEASPLVLETSQSYRVTIVTFEPRIYRSREFVDLFVNLQQVEARLSLEMDKNYNIFHLQGLIVQDYFGTLKENKRVAMFPEEEMERVADLSEWMWFWAGVGGVGMEYLVYELESEGIKTIAAWLNQIIDNMIPFPSVLHRRINLPGVCYTEDIGGNQMNFCKSGFT